MRPIPYLIFLLSLISVTAKAQFPVFAHPSVPQAEQIALMTWDHVPTEDEQLRGIKDVGMNISGMCKAADLPRVKAMGLRCLLNDPVLRGYDLAHLPSDAQISRDVAELTKRYGSDPTVIGFYLHDEPQTPQMAALGHIVKALRAAMPDKIPFVNLFPYREGQAEWYTNYEDYVRTLVDKVHSPLISYDNYALTQGGMGDEFFINLELVRKVALEKRLPFWTCIQSVAHFGYQVPNDATLHLQVYSALAYGARGIEYFTYFTPQRGNYRMGSVDQFGRRTATWEAVRRINAEVAALSPTLAKLHSVVVYHYPESPKFSQGLFSSPLVHFIHMVKDEDQYVSPPVAARFLVGEFEDDQGHAYIMIVNKDLTYSFKFETFFNRPVGHIQRVNPYTGALEPFNEEQNWLAPGGGILLRLD